MRRSQVFLEISAPTTYVVWVNGQYVFNGQYGDYDFFKVYDKIDITSFVKEGKNALAILAYNQGDDSFPYQYKTPAIKSAGSKNWEIKPTIKPIKDIDSWIIPFFVWPK